MFSCCSIPLSEFEQRVTIERPTYVKDSNAGRELTWTVIDAASTDMPARMRALSGSEAFYANRISARAVYSCFVRWRPDADGGPFYVPSDRLLWRGREYNILHTADHESAGRFIYMLLNEGGL